MTAALPALLRARVTDVRDFPTPGVVFKDISPLLADPVALAGAVDALAELVRGAAADVVAGIEARGFVLGAPAAYAARTGFVAVRKQGKLPRETHRESYDLEYGSAQIEVHHDAFAPAQRVLLVDDVLATGGTASAAAALVRRAGAVPVGLAVLLELTPLGGRARLAAAAPDLGVHALLSY